MFLILDTANEKLFAEDAVQQAFIKIIKNLDKINKTFDSSTRNFIAVITKNTAIDIYNKYKNEPVAIDCDYTADTKYDDTSCIVINKETLKRLKEHIKELKPIYQIPLILNAIQGLSVNETAEILGLKPKAVQKRLERARAQLIKALEKEDN